MLTRYHVYHFLAICDLIVLKYWHTLSTAQPILDYETSKGSQIGSWNITLHLESYVMCVFPFLQEQTEQVKISNKQFWRIFDILEKTLLRGRVEKRRMLKFQQSSMKGTSSNILESRQSWNIMLIEEFEHHRFKWPYLLSWFLLLFLYYDSHVIVPYFCNIALAVFYNSY